MRSVLCGSGPRHIAFSPTAPFAYAVNELDNTVTPLAYDAKAGTLSVIEGGSVSSTAIH